MNSEPGPKTQSKSLLSSVPTHPNSSGAGVSTSQLSSDSATPPEAGTSTHDTPSANSKTGKDTQPDLSANHENINAEGSSQVARGDEERTPEPEGAEQQEAVGSMKEEGEVSLTPVNQQIELLEHTPDSVVDDAQEWVPDGDHELKRVKVYELIGARWIDQGTAFCFGQFQEETSEALLIARSERSYNNIILSTVIRSTDVYQRQQETLIVWTEPDGVDYALSFQDPDGCAEVWNFICDVQQHMKAGEDPSIANITSSPPIGPEPASTPVTTASIIRSGHLPQPELGIIGEIERAIKTLARTQTLKERICEYIQQEEYIKSLIDVMNIAEDMESLENLHALCSMMQTILMLNDHTMYEHILEDDLFFGVVGMLEYDPDFPNHKANYREFLHQTSHFHQPIPIRDIGIQRKIHHTYRLQFLKDVVLARALDDSTFNVLNSCIIFNQIDIISHVQMDQTFLREIVKLFVDECMLSGSGPGAATTSSSGPSKNTPLQTPRLLFHGAGDDRSPDKPGDPNAMDVDQKQPLTSPKLVNGATPHVNGRATPSASVPPPILPRSDHYAFAPPEGLSDEELALRREVIILVQQLCIMGKNVQLATRMALFRTLVDRGVLFGVQWAMSLPEREPESKPMISAGGEILVALLDHDLNGVRGHVLKQVVAIEKERVGGRKGAEKAETILEMTCKLMAQSRDLAVQSQIGEALKVWMDVPPGEAAAAVATPAATGTEASSMLGANKGPVRKDDPGTERYMDYFYKECLGTLFRPFYDLPEWSKVTESILPLTREQTNRYVYLCDLLHNFISQHHFRIHFYMLSGDIIVRVASLLKARDKHLRHAAFRIYRLLLRQNNQNMHQQIIKHDILKPILDLTIQESRRDNLLSCSCQEYFDSIRKEQVKELAKHCMTKHEAAIRRLAQSPLGGRRFDQFVAWWNWEVIRMSKEPVPENSKFEKPVDSRGWPQGRASDAEEEDYFNGDDDDEEVISIVQPTSPKVAMGGVPIPSNLKRKRRMAVGHSPKGYRPPLRTPSLGALVDYGEEDEDEDKAKPSSPLPLQSTSRSPSPEVSASPKLAHRQVSVTSSGPPPKRANIDDDDDLLETLARSRSRPESPAPGMMASVDTLRTAEKRRRGEDDEEDDELIMHLRKAKKPDLGMQKERFGFGNISRTKNGDDPPKKMKVKLGASTFAAASTPVPSELGAKDGDTG